MSGTKKHILIYAHYYVPDVASTGQILKELSEGLLSDFKVTVICVVPSYGGVISQEYKQKKYYKENINGVNVIRIRVPEFTKLSKWSRVKNIVSYFYGAVHATKFVNDVDYVFSISQPPILGGLLGVYGKKKLKAKYIYNIQDFNPEQIIAVGYSKLKPLLWFLMKLDKYSCRNSDLVVTVGRDLVETVHNRFKNERMPKTVMVNNWIDENEIYPLDSSNPGVVRFKKNYDLTNKFVIMYSGNIGLYYDLENLIKIMSKYDENVKTLDGRQIVFTFVGNGSLKEYLEKYVKENNIKNIVFIPYQPKNELMYSLNAADVHWCVNAKGIKGVSCPSKGYGIMAVGKPILGVLEEKSEIRELIEESNCGICCDPEDYESVDRAIESFINMSNEEMDEYGIRGRRYLENNLTKNESISKYKTLINSL